MRIRLGDRARRQQCERQTEMGPDESRIGLQHLLEQLDRLLIAPGQVVDAAESRQDDRRQRVNLTRAQHLLEREIEASSRGEKQPEPVPRLRMTRIQVERPLELDFRSGPVPVEAELDERERRVCFGDGLIQLERPIRGGPRPLDGLLPAGLHRTPSAEMA